MQLVLVINDDDVLPSCTDIEWINKALELADKIISNILREIEDRRLPESGNGAVLKTDDTFA